MQLVAVAKLLTKHYKMKRIVNINGKTKEEVLISKLEIENRDLKSKITELNQALQLQQTGVSGSIEIINECKRCQFDSNLGFCPKCDTQAYCH